MSHHGNNPDDPLGARSPEVSEMMRKLLGEFPDGKLNKGDEGALAFEIGTSHGRVVLRFPKPVAWIAFTPEEAMGIAETFVQYARLCGSKKPFTLKIG